MIEAESGGALPDHAEIDIARAYTDAYGDVRKYIASWGRWYEWDGARWAHDNTLHSFDLARKLCRTRAQFAGRTAAAIASAKTVWAVERLARADRQHAAIAAQFDADPWALNSPSGVINLRTGALRAHRREDWHTKITAVGPATTGAPKWREFLKRVTDGDEALQRYQQRLAGYSLTGCVDEHVFFFLHGSGANGKSTFLNCISGILGDYSVTASPETFCETSGERHPTDLAWLRGARLVVAQEIDEGRRWALARIKALTGGDCVAARFVRADFFTYTPAFKLCLSANHRPGLRSIDEAIRRRLHVVPFPVRIPEADRDLRLSAALRDEWGSILQWAMEGCADWQAMGLSPPHAVRSAVAEYLSEEDLLQHWIEDSCEQEPSAFQPVGRLYGSYRRWAERAGERVLGSKRFSQALSERGFVRGKGGAGVRGFHGLRLILEADLVELAEGCQ